MEALAKVAAGRRLPRLALQSVGLRGEERWGWIGVRPDVEVVVRVESGEGDGDGEERVEDTEEVEGEVEGEGEGGEEGEGKGEMEKVVVTFRATAGRAVETMWRWNGCASTRAI